MSRYELSNISYRNISFRLEGVRQSEQAELIAKTASFTLTSGQDEYDLTANYPDFVIPLWAEYRSFSYLSNPVWIFLPTVHLSMLAKKRGMAEYACSFYGEQPREVIFKTSLYGNEVFTPNATIQVFYSPTIPFPGTEDADIDLPENLVNMLFYDDVIDALALMEVNAAAITDDPAIDKQVAAWRRLYVHYVEKRREFSVFYEKWRTESRGSHRPRRRGDVLKNQMGSGPRFPWFVRNS